MGDQFEELARRLVRDYRHLMTEAERCADRAFAFQEKLSDASDADAKAKLAAAIEQAFGDPMAEEMFRAGRSVFLQRLGRRILKEHAETLPRCAMCGGILKTASPKECFSCDPEQPA